MISIKMLCGVPLVAFMVASGYVRLARVDAVDWHIDLAALRFAADRGVVVQDNGALVLSEGTLARLEAVALATRRTKVIAGSVAEGRITWQTRTLIWGFADYTTAQQMADGVRIYARSRFGSHDYGVNAARLRAWIAAM